MRQLETFDERYFYLRLRGTLGEETFGFDRWINQRFYKSQEWKLVRNHILIRDNGCDLGVSGYEIHANPMVHHMNPVNVDDILHAEEWLLDPNFLITTSITTHNAIHYGDESLLPRAPVERKAGDTKLW